VIGDIDVPVDIHGDPKRAVQITERQHTFGVGAVRLRRLFYDLIFDVVGNVEATAAIHGESVRASIATDESGRQRS
jgi:hypothetical protein